MSDARRARAPRARRAARVRRHPRHARRLGTATHTASATTPPCSPCPTGERLVASTDASVEGVHFRREWLTPREIGARAAAAALSDLAAMAATPIGLLLALGVPQIVARRDRGGRARRREMASRARCPIVGGNLSRADVLSLTITVLGAAAAPLARAGARAGDVALRDRAARRAGDRAAGADCAAHAPRAAHRERFASPRPRLDEARWLAERGATRGDRHLRRARSPMRGISPRRARCAIELDRIALSVRRRA